MTTARRVPFKTVVLPNEHGAWGFWLEPVLLGMLLAPSRAGLGLMLASLAALFLQHPLSLFLTDKRRGHIFPRTYPALQFASLYGVIVLLSLSLTALSTKSVLWTVPLVLAAPFAFVQLEHKTRNQGRSLVAELAGATAMSALAPSLLLLGSYSMTLVGALWLLLLVRSLPSILYVRARLRSGRGESVARGTPVIVSTAACVLASVLVYADVLPFLVLPVLALLLFRTVFGLSKVRRKVRARTVGILEMMYGLMLVSAVWLGSLFHF